jgi:hypothetical protein
MIADLIGRDGPFYEPVISEETVSQLQQFAMSIGLLREPLPYAQVVASRFDHLWTA